MRLFLNNLVVRSKLEHVKPLNKGSFARRVGLLSFISFVSRLI